MEKDTQLKIGKAAFLVSIIIVLIANIIIVPYTTIILVILGLVIGLLNISKGEIQRFLIPGIGLLIVGTAGLEILPAIGGYLTGVLKNLVALIAPAIVVVAVKELYEVARRV